MTGISFIYRFPEGRPTLIDCPILYIVAALVALAKAISPRFRARCFFQDFNGLRVPGDHEWNGMVLEFLMDDYGYSQ